MSEKARWAADADSIDYAHLGKPFAAESFTFTAGDLARLAELNRFPLTSGRDRVLFGLRGCVIADGGGSFRDEVRLAEAVPDHVNFLCTLGVWDRSTNKIAVFSGSTVPNAHFMPLQLGTDAPKCNLLLTGCHRFTVGIHLAGGSGEMRGVFKEGQTVVVLRSKKDLCYQNTDDFDSGRPGDNIHPSRKPKDGMLFSSEGCQTVHGFFEQPAGHHGEWGEFRKLAGLKASQELVNDPPFDYVLLTGREARLAATLPPAELDSLKRLRFGSAGDSVTKLQKALEGGGFFEGSADGSMKQGTVMALIKRQHSGGSTKADGIFPG